MPSFSGSMASPIKPPPPKPKKNTASANIVTLNVGGHLFQTTKQTLSITPPTSLLHPLSLPNTNTHSSSIPFIDRDPDLFSILLSLLRTGHLPSKSNSFSPQDLLSESHFYGISSLLHPSQIDPFTLRYSSSLPLNGRDTPSSISTTPSGSLHLSHGSKITSFDSSLRRRRTILTHFAAVDSLLSLSPSLVAAGATDFSGLHILDTEKSILRHNLSWENATLSVSTVQAIGSSPDHLFASFESGRRSSNTIIVYDLNRDLLPTAQIGTTEVHGGADLESYMPATKLCWVPSRGLVMSSGSRSGPYKTTGMVRLWDLRCGKPVWELRERVDCFADVTVADGLGAIFKVGESSGEVFYADLRKLEVGGRAWVGMEDGRKVGRKEGVGCRVESCGDKVFRTRGGEVEMWSEVVVGGGEVGVLEERVMRRNGVGRGEEEVGKRNRITEIKFGGDSMFLCRKDMQCVEVWQSSSSCIRV